MLPGSGGIHILLKSSVTNVTGVTVVDNLLYLLDIVRVTLCLSMNFFGVLLSQLV
jgi:hypothetical protein